MAGSNKKTVNTVNIPPTRFRIPDETPNSGMFSKDRPRRGPGRPPGSGNKFSRAAKEAALAAVEDLGRTDLDKWPEEAKKADPDNPTKRLFKVLAVEDMRTFMRILARLFPKDQPAKKPRSPSR
jgi:hypothetical protein